MKIRTFISINLPEDVRKEIKKIQDSLPEFEGKKTELENLHLTLKFLGEIDEEMLEKVKEGLGEVKMERFEGEIDKIGFFSPKFIRIIWLHLKNCNELQKKIDDALEGLFETEQRFMSHLTIARIKNIKNKQKFLGQLSRIKIEKRKFVVDKFYLLKSTLTAKGPVYSILGEFDLM